MTAPRVCPWPWILLIMFLVSGVTIVLSSTTSDINEPISSFILQGETQTSNRPPRAISGGPYTGMEGTLLHFDGSASCDPDGVIDEYNWAFGDNTTATTPQHDKQYLQEGNYSVTLTVTDDRGATTNQTTFALISDLSPLSDFTGSPLQGPAPLTVQFTDQSSSYDGVRTWHWKLDKNITSTSTHPQHTYTQSGLYTVTLTVTEADGDHDTITKSNYINVSQPTSPPSHNAPTLKTPSSFPTLTVGTTIHQAIIVQNNDSPPLNRSTFHLTLRTPSNWTATIKPATLTLDPGANATVILSLSPSSTTPPQQYNLSISIQNIDFPALQTILSLPIQVVAPPPEQAVPSVTLSPFLAIGLNGSSAQYDIHIRNNDASAFPPSIFTINTTLPALWTSSSNPPATTLAPGESTIATLTVIAPSTATPQNYTFTVTVLHTANTSYNGHTMGIFSVISQNGEIPSNEKPSQPPTSLNVSVHLDPEIPTSNQTMIFTIHTDASRDTKTQIRIYVDEILIHQDTMNGTCTYKGGPFPVGPHTLHIEVEDKDGVITRVPANNTWIFTVTPIEFSLPSFSWQGLASAILPLFILDGISYIIAPKRSS